MNVEDEYFGLIEEKDTAIRQQNQHLAEQGAQLKEKDELLLQRDEQLSQQSGQIVTLVKMLISSGRTIEDVALFLGTTPDNISALLKI